MTFPRRDFLKTSFGLGIGTAVTGLSGLARAAVPTAEAASTVPQLDEYERILATTKSLNVLGRPRSWSIVQQGFLPISPERVLLQPRDSSPTTDRRGYRPGVTVAATVNSLHGGFTEWTNLSNGRSLWKGVVI